jgi:hypothetical protein
MAKSGSRHASIKPSEQQEGGTFGFPAGSHVTIQEASWVTWEDAGEKASSGREDDPCLKLVGEIEGNEDAEPVIEHLGAGKATRLVPSEDGEFIDQAEGAPADASLSKSSNAGIFIQSLCDKKVLGKKALPETMFEGEISALVGLKFEVGKKMPEQRQGEGESEFKRRPTTIAQDIIEAPGGKKGGKKKKAVADDEDEAPAKKGKAKGGADDTDEAAEKALLEALDNPKYRKGLPKARAFTAVHALVKDQDDAEEICEKIQDEEWVTSDDRPWEYNSEEELITKA